MKSQMAIPFLFFSAVIFFCRQAEGRRNKKTRTLIVVQNEVEDIKDALINQTGTLQWQPTITKHAFLDDEDFSFGVLPDTTASNKKTRRAPPNRVPPLKPGETTRPTGKIKLPKEYNGRAVFGDRCPSFNHVLYQGSCGNCWAVATTALINDRVCMYNNDTETEKFWSAKHLTTCLKKGCDGGWFADALQFWVTDGLVEGGDYRQNEPPGCKPYPRNTGDMKTAQCVPTCDDGRQYGDDMKTFGGARYEIRTKNVVEIMGEIYLYGPVIATFDVYDDLAHFYKSGVYKRVSTKKLGGHACKLYGWGEENGVKFWYAANSWGKDWGDGGFFKIQRGVNECNIEANIHAAVPSVGLVYTDNYQVPAI